MVAGCEAINPFGVPFYRVMVVQEWLRDTPMLRMEKQKKSAVRMALDSAAQHVS